VKLAVLSDVHGNLLALEAVLDDIARQGVDATVALGDFVSGPFDPAGVADRFIGLGLPSVRGNHDRFITDGREKDWHIDALARNTLTPEQHAWLAELPATRVLDDQILLSHGTPRDDNTGWLDGFVGDNVMLLPPATIEGHAAGFDYPVLLCGHTHVPRSVRLKDGRLVVNPGSVGLPFEIGSPDARYAIVEKRAGRWATQLRAIPYDHERAARQARDKGYDAWAEAISGGWISPRGL
jgi:putative phosphoesterase